MDFLRMANKIYENAYDFNPMKNGNNIADYPSNALGYFKCTRY